MIMMRVFKKYGGFDSAVGMQGINISAHEETGFFEKLWSRENNQRVNIFYTPKLVFRHYIQDFKLSVYYLLKRSFSSGQAWFLKMGKMGFPKRLGLAVMSLLYVSGQSLISAVTFFFYGNKNQWLIEKVNKVFFGFGFLLKVLGITINTKQQ
jgi:hypothetical protein